jgi:hypothetical protein
VALELNGGVIVALPSLGALFGSIWSRGIHWPIAGVGAFIAGLILAALGYAFAFFHFFYWQGVVEEEMA